MMNVLTHHPTAPSPSVLPDLLQKPQILPSIVAVETLLTKLGQKMKGAAREGTPSPPQL